MKDMILRFWKKWFGEKAEQVVNNASEGVVASSSVKKENSEPSTVLQRLEKFLMSKYDFRFNVLTEQTEYRRKGEEAFREVEQRVLNTLCIDARSQGINCWDKDVSRLLLSEKIVDYHPFVEYVDSLPEWDGMDRVSELALRVSDKPLWVNGFHCWMLAMVAQWMNLDSQCANAVAPLLVSTEQGRCKSTF